MKYFEELVSWMNENNTEFTWFMIGFFLCEFFHNLGKRDWISCVWNIVLAITMYATRKLRV
jgi:hypothetical protein